MRIQVTNNDTGNASSEMIPRHKNPVRIGRSHQCDIRLGGRVPDEAAHIYNDTKQWILRVLCEGCLVDRNMVKEKSEWPIKETICLQLGRYSVDIHVEGAPISTEQARLEVLDERYLVVVNRIQDTLVSDSGGLSYGSSEEVSDEQILSFEKHVEKIATEIDELPQSDLISTDLGNYIAGIYVRNRLLTSVGEKERPPASRKRSWTRLLTARSDYEENVSVCVAQLKNDFELDDKWDYSKAVGVIEDAYWTRWAEMVETLTPHLCRYLCMMQIKKEMKDVCYGWGPLEELLDDPAVNEIMVNDANHIFVERWNELENSGRRFVKGDAGVMEVIKKIASRVNRRIDSTTPMLDARLADGSRVNAIIDPLSVKGPCLTIRRFPETVVTCEQLIEWGAMTPLVKDFLRAAVIHRANIMISGGTGTGKTTMLNAISGFIPDKERIVTIEDTAELQLRKEHVVSLEAKPPNIEGQGEINIRMLVRNALRMRPDRIVVGECRGGEAIDMLQAMNTGHDGSMTTIHANSAEDVIKRLEVLIQQFSTTSLPVSSIHSQIVSALDFIVQLTRASVPDPNNPKQKRKRRYVSEISEVVSYDAENQRVILRPLFVRQDNHRFSPTGRLPTMIDQFCESGAMNLEQFLNFDQEVSW